MINKRFILPSLIFTFICLCLTVSAGAQTGTLTAADYFNLAEQLYKKNDLDGAIANYSKALELDPKYTDAYYNRGYIYAWKLVFSQV